MESLSEKQKLFIAEYLVDLNATAAYLRAGYKATGNSAEVNACRLLSNAKVQEKIKEAMKEREKRTEITQDKVLKEIAKIAFANGTDFAKVVEKTEIEPVYNNDGEKTGVREIVYKTVELVETDTLPDDKKDVISSIKHGKHGIEVASYDKLKALELLGKHLGMFTEKIELDGSLVQIVDNIPRSGKG